jgi:hypothetical protein
MSHRTVCKKYLKTTGPDELKVEVYYSLGGFNLWNYQKEPRGYWLSVTPVNHSEQNGVRFESVVLGSGLKKFLKETQSDRRGGRAEKDAVELAKQYEAELVNQVCIKEKLTLAA